MRNRRPRTPGNLPTYVPDPKTLPAPEKPQPTAMRPGSRMAVLGVFIEVVRRSFSPGVKPPNFQWLWDPDIKKTKIAIESSFNEDVTYRNFKPAIQIDIDDQTHGRVVLGDKAGQNLRTGAVHFWDLATVPILIECIAAKRAESAIIGDLVGAFLHTASDILQAKFAFHDMTPVTVGRTQPYTMADKDTWVTSVTFNVQHVMRWRNLPVAPLLREIELQATGTGEDADVFFETLAIGWKNKGG
jgi:hypothetical protein